MKWAKRDLVVTANYKSTFHLMSLLLHSVKCSWLGINMLTFAVPQYLYIMTAHFASFTTPRPLTTVTEKSCLSVSHKWIQAAFVRLFYGFPNCWHNAGSLLPSINERISAASQPGSQAACLPQAVDINHKAGKSHSSLLLCFCQYRTPEEQKWQHHKR